MLVLVVARCSFFVPDMKSAADRAHAIAPKCASAPPMPPPDAFERVEPAYARVLGGPNGSEVRLRGARIQIRPFGGTSAESLARTLNQRS
jgi:hypothetical protein